MQIYVYLEEGEHHMVWNAKTELYIDELKYTVQAIWDIYLEDAALPKGFPR